MWQFFKVIVNFRKIEKFQILRNWKFIPKFQLQIEILCSIKISANSHLSFKFGWIFPWNSKNVKFPLKTFIFSKFSAPTALKIWSVSSLPDPILVSTGVLDQVIQRLWQSKLNMAYAIQHVHKIRRIDLGQWCHGHAYTHISTYVPGSKLWHTCTHEYKNRYNATNLPWSKSWHTFIQTVGPFGGGDRPKGGD